MRYAIYMFISDLILDFIEHLEVEGGRSAKTAENYRLYLERFVEFTDNMSVDKITTETIRKYRLWLNRYKNYNDDELATITQSYHLIALRGFLSYLSKRDSGKEQIKYIKQKAMADSVADAYGAKLAAKMKITVSDKEIDDFMVTQRRYGDDLISKQTFNTVNLDYFNWSQDEYRHIIKKQTNTT